MTKKKRSVLAIVILALVRLVLNISNGSVCGITFYQPKVPDLQELFERGGYNKKLMSLARKASTALAAFALVVATTSVPSACFHQFAQPVETEALRDFVNKM